MKSNRIWPLIVVAIVVIAVGLPLLLQDRERPITIAFVGFTNVAEKTFALFVATNTNSRTLRYYDHLEQKSESGWPSDSAWPPPPANNPSVDVLPHQSFIIHVFPPAGSEAPWRVCLTYSLHAHSPLGKLRWRVANWFYNRNYYTIGRTLHEGPSGFDVTGPEMRNERQTAKPQVPVRAVQ
jgi:hypothetical protein